MFEYVLPGNTKAILAILEKTQIMQNAYLAGGTALALQLRVKKIELRQRKAAGE